MKCENNSVGQDQHFILMKWEKRNISKCYLLDSPRPIICVLHHDEKSICNQISQSEEVCKMMP